MKLIKDLIKWYENQINNCESYEADSRILLGINNSDITKEIYKDTLKILKNIKEEYKEVCIGDLGKGDTFIYDDTWFQVDGIIQVISDSKNAKIVKATSTTGTARYFGSNYKVYCLIEHNFARNDIIDNNIHNIIDDNIKLDVDEINAIKTINEETVAVDVRNAAFIQNSNKLINDNQNNKSVTINETPLSYEEEFNQMRNKFLDYVYSKLVNKFPDGSLKRDEIGDLIISVTINKNEFDIINVTYRHPVKHINLVQRISMEELCAKTGIQYGTYFNMQGILDIFNQNIIEG